MSLLRRLVAPSPLVVLVAAVAGPLLPSTARAESYAWSVDATPTTENGLCGAVPAGFSFTMAWNTEIAEDATYSSGTRGHYTDDARIVLVFDEDIGYGTSMADEEVLVFNGYGGVDGFEATAVPTDAVAFTVTLRSSNTSLWSSDDLPGELNIANFDNEATFTLAESDDGSACEFSGTIDLVTPGEVDADLDGYDTSSDCDDSNATINPGATETCNAADDNCDGEIDEGTELTFYADADGDGYGDVAVTELACTESAGWVADDTDCDDTEALRNPGVAEVCDEIDNDCDDEVDDGVELTFYMDGDADGYGDAAISALACAATAGWVASDTDCDDAVGSTHPGAGETCNEVDDDCDDSVDEGVTTTFYMDGDGDSFGDASMPAEACAAPSQYVRDATDCDDSDGTVNPAVEEACDGVDEDCNGTVDDLPESSADGAIYFADIDGDAFGDADTTMRRCAATADWVADSSDCDDRRSWINPDATETCDGGDEDCNGATDDIDPAGTEGFVLYADGDGDGYGTDGSSVRGCDEEDGWVFDRDDCDDADPAISPAATDDPTAPNFVDEDCDGSDAVPVDDFTFTLEGGGYAATSVAVDGIVIHFPSGTTFPAGTDFEITYTSAVVGIAISGVSLPAGQTKSVEIEMSPSTDALWGFADGYVDGSAVVRGCVIDRSSAEDPLETAFVECPGTPIRADYDYRGLARTRAGSRLLFDDDSGTRAAAMEWDTSPSSLSVALQASTVTAGGIMSRSGASSMGGAAVRWSAPGTMSFDIGELSNTTIVLYGDLDGDGLADLDEALVHGTSSSEADTDGDSVEDGDEVAMGTDPASRTDWADPDADDDGLSASREAALGTDPASDDTDGDGVADDDELWDGTDPTDSLTFAALDGNGNGTDDRLEDADGDGISRADEEQLGTQDSAGDSDGDGVSDRQELLTGSDPAQADRDIADADGDGIDDGDQDDDGDGLWNWEEDFYGTSRSRWDSDGDGVADVDEVDDRTSPTDPLARYRYDADGDLIDDRADNCADVPNPDQFDGDGDGIGAACDADEADTGIPDTGDTGDTGGDSDTDTGTADTGGGGGGDDTGADAPPGCGCGTAGAAGSAGLALVAVGLAASRRRRA